MHKRSSPWKWRRLVLTFGPPIVCVLACWSAFQWILFGCLWWGCTNTRPFNAQEIQIPQAYFPSGATYNSLYPDSELAGARQRESQTIYWGNSNRTATAVFIATRYAGAPRAANRFALELRINSDTPGVPWPRPTAITYESSTADQFFVGCGTSPFGPRCAYVARYDEYLLVLSATIDKQMTLSSFERIVQYLDTEAAMRLRRQSK